MAAAEVSIEDEFYNALYDFKSIENEFESTEEDDVPKEVGVDPEQPSAESRPKANRRGWNLEHPPRLKPDRRGWNFKKNPPAENASTSGGSNLKITQAMIDEEAAFKKKILAEEKKAEQKRKLELTRQAAYEKLQKLLQCSKKYSNFLLQEIDRLQKNSDSKENANDKENLGSKKRANKESNNPSESKRQKLDNPLEKPTYGHEKVGNINTTESEHDPKEETRAANKRTLPVLLSGGELRPYQVEGFDWLTLMYENGVSCILADEMGLGKTVQSIAFISHLIEKGIRGPFLICAPLSTLPNWVLEFEKFAPNIPVLLFHGPKDTRKKLHKEIRAIYEFGNYSSCPVVVTSYQMPLMEKRLFGSVHWRTIIIDEGHRIKNINSCLRSRLEQFHVDHKILLTGTPLQNDLTELWSLLNFILPDIFGDLAVFESWFDVTSMTEKGGADEIINQEQDKHVLLLMHEILSPFLLRRTKADVEMFLPAKKEMWVYAPMTARQERLYRMTADKTIGQLLERHKEEESVERTASGRIKRKCNYEKGVEEEKPEVTHKFFLTPQCVMMQLRNICNHPYLVEQPMDPNTGYYEITEEVVEDCGKLQVLDCLLKGLKTRGHKVLIFSQMVRMLDIIKDYCDLREWTYCRLHGSMNLSDRGLEIKRFNEDPEVFLFLISTRAGGLGLNLMSADTVILYDSDWNPQCDLQAQDRCHRIGQTKPVVVYRLITQCSIEERMVTRATAKRKLEKMIMKKGMFSGVKKGTKVDSLSMEELKEILTSDHREKVTSRKGDIFTPEEVNMLLDRSDLLRENSQVTSPEVKGLFKVISSNV